jgi:archaeosortase C (PEF-CTERM variant)
MGKRTEAQGTDGVGPARKYLGLAPRWWLAVGLIMAFVGVNLQLLTHIVSVRWFGIGLIIVGMAAAVYWVRFIERAAPERKPLRRRDLADRFVHYLTINGHLRPWLPIIGIIVILIDLAWNLVIAHSAEFLSQDWTMWALGVVLLAYNFVPAPYGKERDFALILIFFYSVTMVLPMGLYRLATGTIDLPGGFVYWMLGVPVAALVRLTGAWASAHGIFIDFQESTGQFGSLGISTGCAGLDSLFLFVSGFIAFMLVENARMDRRIGAALVLGILTAYFANLLRMVIIVEAGVYWGQMAMMAVHENAGTLIFLGWIAVFWYLMYRFVLRRPDTTEEAGEASGTVDGEAAGAGAASDGGESGKGAGGDDLKCAACGALVDPEAIPEKCPSCGQPFEPGVFCGKCGREMDPDDLPGKCPSCGNPFGD